MSKRAFKPYKSLLISIIQTNINLNAALIASHRTNTHLVVARIKPNTLGAQLCVDAINCLITLWRAALGNLYD